MNNGSTNIRLPGGKTIQGVQIAPNLYTPDLPAGRKCRFTGS